VSFLWRRRRRGIRRRRDEISFVWLGVISWAVVPGNDRAMRGRRKVDVGRWMGGLPCSRNYDGLTVWADGGILICLQP